MLKKNGGNNKSKRNSSDEEAGGAGPSREMFRQSSQASPLFRKSVSIDPPESLSDAEQRPRPPSQQSARGEGKKKILSTFLSNLFGNKTPEDELNNGSNIDGKKSTSRESVNSVLSSSSFSYVNPKKIGGKQMKGKRIPVDDPNYGKTGDGRKTLGATLDRIGMKMGLKKKYNLQSCESLQYIDACDDAPPLPLLEVLTGSSPPKSATTVANNSTQVLLSSSDYQLGQDEIVPTTVTELSAECRAITNHFSDKLNSKPVDNTSAEGQPALKEVDMKSENISSPQNVPQKIIVTKVISPSSVVASPKIGPSTNSIASISQDSPKQTTTDITYKLGTKTTPSTSANILINKNLSTEDTSKQIAIKNTSSTKDTPKIVELKTISLAPDQKLATTTNASQQLNTKTTSTTPGASQNLTKMSSTTGESLILATETNSTADASQNLARKITSSTPNTSHQLVTKLTSPTDASQKLTAKSTSSNTDASQKLVTKTTSPAQDKHQFIEIKTNPSQDASNKLATTYSVENGQTKAATSTVSTSSQVGLQKPSILPTSSPESIQQSISSTSEIPSKLTTPSPITSSSLQDELPAKGKAVSSSVQTISPPVAPSLDSVNKPTENSKLTAQTKECKEDSSVSPTKSVLVYKQLETLKETKTELTEPTQEPVASTSKACFASSHDTTGSSNTWSNSTQRKRRAPPPPTGKSSQKFVNGVSSSNSNSFVTDILNDVPSSSSHAAALIKFKRINESPVRSLGTFEIRPRKKERSVEPPSVSRPVSYIATQNNSNTTIYSPHSLRYHHKRSSSESYSNTNTRGRIHKPGKKKAPPPPNPFGDPDAEEEGTEDSHTPVSPIANNENSNETGASGNTSRENASSTSSSSFSSPQVVKKSSEKPPIIPKAVPSVAVSTQQTQEPIATTSSPNPNSKIQTSSSTVVPVASTESPVTPNIAPLTQTASTAVTVTTPATDSVDCSSDELEEIRQNMLNDQQERQLLASDPLAIVSTTIETQSNTQMINSTTAAQAESSNTNHALSRNDIQAAENTLQALTASINTTKPKEPTTPNTAKAKLIELKKEAEKSPLNAVPKKSRPASIGSSIYESPLSLLLGKSTSNSAATGESSAENSPRSTPKPWYKRSASSAFAKQLLVSPKSKQSSAKPFTALVKFSELDKEAGKIVEENRRKSAEQRFNENAQELLALFSHTFPEPSRTQETGESSATPAQASTTSTSSPTKVSTIAQVHAISEETEIANGEESTATGSPISNQNSSTSPSSGGSAGSMPPTNTGNSSPPAFQSVHAASKHRQINPLLTTSPSTAVRSDKLAIVQPQSSSNKGKESTDKMPWRVSRTSTQTSTASAVLTASPTTIASSSSLSSQPSAINASSTPAISASSPALRTSSVETTHITPSISSSSTSIHSSTNPTSSLTSSTPSISTTTTTVVTPTQAKPANANEQQWDCPRCTLKNPSWRILCEICFQRKDPISSNSYISSILQRVNAESSKVSSSTVTSETTTTPAAITTTTYISFARQRTPTQNDTSSVITSVPPINPINSPSSSSTAIPSGQSFTSTTSTSSFIHHPQNRTTRQIFEAKNSDIPSCENFLSQLPAKQDLAKEEKLYGMKLHEDPELEELDIGKLREVRLAYFQKQNSTSSTTSYHSVASSSSADESVESPTKTNDLGTHEQIHHHHHHHHPNANLISRDDTYSPSQQASHKRASSISLCEVDEKPTEPQQKFADNDDDFIDYILQLDNNNESPTNNVSNITEADASCLQNLKPTSSTSLPSSSGVTPTATTTQPPTSSPNIFLQARYRPRLEMIREGNSGDYTYCYSSTEIAQIYENWQANENGNGIGNKSLVNASSSSSSSQAASSSLHPFPQQTHLFEYQQPQQQTSTTVHQHHHPMVFSNNVYPTASPFHSMQGNFVPILPVDHQPFANNRLSHSPEDNYVNTMAGIGMAPTATATPTLNETANISCATSPVRFSPFPLVRSNNVNDTGSINISNNNNNMSRSGDRQINQRFGESSSSSNYENNGMNLTPGSSRRLTYEDYRRMGAIPKGYSFGSKNDDWSSESSCDTDTSSRQYWARAGYQDSLHGMTRRGNLDFPHEQSNGYPEQSAAHGKLMKRLESAITNGDHRLAATLAHDLALMKVNCVVAKINQPFSIRVYVEDRFMQQGPFLIQVSSMMTVHELKGKIESDWGIPSGFQKWILGRKMAEDDNLSLSSYEMAQDSMAFLFLVTPEIGNIRPNVVPIDNKASNNNPSVNETSTIKNINKSDRNSMSPTQRNIMPSYSNLNENSSQHVYNNFSMDNVNNIVEQSAQTRQSPRIVRKSLQSPPASVTEANVNAPSSSSVPKPNHQQQTNEMVAAQSKKISSAAQTTKPTLASTVVTPNAEKTDNRSVITRQESSPPPLPTRSPIPHVQAKSENEGNNTPLKAHSKTPERTSSNSGSLKSNQKNVKQQNNSSPKSATNQGQQQTSVNTETLNAASVLTLSLQQKLAEFKNLAELTFGKSGVPAAPAPNRSIKEPSPVSSKIINKSENEKKVDPKEGKPPKKPGKAQPGVPISSKEKRLTSANSSTEKLAADGLKSDNEKSPVKENRFNGVLLPTPKENENVKPPERSDKSKTSSGGGGEATAKQRLPKADKVIYENRPKDTVKSDESTTKPTVIKEKSPEVIIKQSSANATPVVAKVVEESSKKPVESPVVSVNSQSSTHIITQEEMSAPIPMPRGLKKQQSVERELQSPETTSSAPKPAPRTASNKVVPTTGATCESKDPQHLPPQENASSIPPVVHATTSNTSKPTQEAVQQLQGVVEGGCQTTLPFPLAKHRGNTASPNFNATTSTSAVKAADPVYNEKGTTSLLRPSAFVTQQSKSENDRNSFNSTSNSSSSSVLLSSFITGKSTSSPIAPTTIQPPANVNNFTVTSSSSSTITTSPNNIAHVQPFSTTTKQISTPTAHVAPYPSSSSNSILPPPEAPSKGKSKEDNVNSYQKMLELMEKQDLIFTSEDTECPVCFAPLSAGDGIILRDCLHVFCKECLVGCVQYADDSTVKCPYRDADYSCSNNLQEREIKALVPTEVFEKYLARSVKLAESKIVNTFHCKTPDCTGWCVFEDDVNVFVCPVCKKRNCLTCAAIHDGIDCLRFQRELAIAAETDEDAKQSRLMLEKMIQRGEALECPACHVVLLKKWGCDWVRCSYCKTEICWVTKGFRWGKGGKGDVSGGCKCGVNGVRCHPKCTYCH